MFQHAQQVASQLEMNMTVEHGIMTRIRALSEQICEPGYRADRVELMDTRSVLVQQLLNALVAKQRVVGASEAKMMLLEKKQRSFEQAQSTCLRARRAEVARHGTVAEDLIRKDEFLERYLQQKLQALASEDQAAEIRAEQRAKKVLRVSEHLQEAFAGILETIEECRHDKSRLSQSVLDRDHSTQISVELQRTIAELQDLYANLSMQTDKAAKLEINFSDWLQEVYSAMREQASQSFQVLRTNFSTDKARMLSLSRIAVEHVRAQREQVARALEQKGFELASCQEAVSIMEFSRPCDEEITRTLGRLEQVHEQLKWQEHEVDALTLVEERISHDAAEIVSDTFGADSQSTLSEDRWGQEVAHADAWVTDFFYTWSKDLPTHQPRHSIMSVSSTHGVPYPSRERSTTGGSRYAGQRQLTVGNPPIPPAMLTSGSLEADGAIPEPVAFQVVSTAVPLEGKQVGSTTSSPPRHAAAPQFFSSAPWLDTDAAAAAAARVSPRMALRPQQAVPVGAGAFMSSSTGPIVSTNGASALSIRSIPDVPGANMEESLSGKLDVERLFGKLDMNRDGVIDKQELRRAIQGGMVFPGTGRFPSDGSVATSATASPGKIQAHRQGPSRGGLGGYPSGDTILVPSTLSPRLGPVNGVFRQFSAPSNVSVPAHVGHSSAWDPPASRGAPSSVGSLASIPAYRSVPPPQAASASSWSSLPTGQARAAAIRQPAMVQASSDRSPTFAMPAPTNIVAAGATSAPAHRVMRSSSAASLLQRR